MDTKLQNQIVDHLPNDPRIGEILLKHTSLTNEQLDEALAAKDKEGGRLGDILLAKKFVLPHEMMRALCVQMGLRYEEDLKPIEIDPALVNNIPINYAKQRGILPLVKGEESVTVAVGDPFNLEGLEDMRVFFEAVDIRPVISSPMRIQDAINKVYERNTGDVIENISEEDEESYDLESSVDILDATEDEAPVIRFVNSMIHRAVKEKASDIHVEPYDKEVVIRFRIDGVLQDILHQPRHVHAAVTSRIKIMANLDIAEKRLPQDGRMSLRVGEKQIDVRVSVWPTQHGERIVLRLLDKQALRFRIDGLGMRSKLAKSFEELIHSPHGIFLVTGPTGSGKTTSLYAGISVLDKDKLNILTIEDPIEYDLDGVGQTQVNSKIDFTFAMGLRSILRQDPDVVLIGEIRDLETAEISVQASLTGHLVLSTLHTNTAIGAVTRLLNMGVEPFLISSSLIGILAQRLVRKLCPNCKQLVEPGGGIGVWEDTGFSNRVFQRHYEPRGCQTCAFTGYRGRTGIYELIIVDDTLRSMIHEKRPEHEMLAHARLTSVGIQESGLELVKAGITSTGELTRVTVQ